MPKDTESNSVLLSGEVASECTFSHEIYGEGFYTFKVKSKRLSGVEDLLPITVSERITCINDLLIGKKINIKGQIRSYNSFQIKKSRLLLTIFAREITEVEAEDTNQIFLNGFICKPPIYRTTPFGREITDVLLAVNRSYNKSDYIPCVFWGRNAKYMCNLPVGSNVKVWGRIQSRGYEKKMEDAVEQRVAYEVSISKIERESNV